MDKKNHKHKYQFMYTEKQTETEGVTAVYVQREWAYFVCKCLDVIKKEVSIKK